MNFCSTGCFLVHMGGKGRLDSRLSSLMVAFLDAASAGMFSEALGVIFLKLCSLVMPPLLQGTAERKHFNAAVHGLLVLRALGVTELSKLEKKSCSCCLCPS